MTPYAQSEYHEEGIAGSPGLNDCVEECQGQSVFVSGSCTDKSQRNMTATSSSDTPKI
jgi:hypothetical protein